MSALHSFFRTTTIILVLGAARLFAGGGINSPVLVPATVSYSYQGPFANPRLASTTSPANTSLPASISFNTTFTEGKTWTVSLIARDITTYRFSVSVPEDYDVYINGIARRAIILNGYRDADGNAVPGTVTRPLSVTVVRHWAGASNFVSGSSPEGELLGAASPIQLGVPYYDTNHPEDLIPNLPRLDFNLGLAYNGKPLPPLKVNLYGRFYLKADMPEYPDVPDVLVQTVGSTVWIKAPQVTAIYSLASGSDTNPVPGTGGYLLKFAQRGQESSPFLTYTFDIANHKVTKQFTGATGSMVTNWVSNSQEQAEGTSFDDWHETGGAVQRHVALTTDSSLEFATFAVSDAAGTVATKTRTWYYRNITVVDAGDGYTNTYTRWTPQWQSEGYGGETSYSTDFHLGVDNQVIGQTSSIGNRVASQMSDNKLPSATYRTWLNNSPTVTQTTDTNLRITGVTIAANGSARTDFTYTNDWNGFPRLARSQRTTVGTQLIAESSTEYQFDAIGSGGTSFIANGQPYYVATTYAFSAPGASGTIPRPESDGARLRTIAKYYREDAPDPTFAGLPYSIQREDDTKASYTYERGSYDGTTFNPGNGEDLRITCLHGLKDGAAGSTSFSTLPSGTTLDPVGLVAATVNGVTTSRSTKLVEIRQRGLLMRREQHVYSGGTSFDLIAWENFTYGSDGRLLGRQSSNGDNFANAWRTDFPDRKFTHTDATGIVTTFRYDSMGRVTSASRPAAGSSPAQYISYVYDGDNRITDTYHGPVDGERLHAYTTFDTGGRVREFRTVDGAITSINYESGDRIVHSTLKTGTAAAPTTTTRTTTAYNDGRIQTIDGSAVIGTEYAYDFDASHRLRRKTTVASARISYLSYDLLGRAVEETHDGFGSATEATIWEYNTFGQLTRVHAERRTSGSPVPLSADRLFTYDSFGEVTASGYDLDGTGTLTPLSTDRYVARAATLTKDSDGAWWSSAVSTTYSKNSDDTKFVQAENRIRLSLPVGTLSETTAIDIYGNPASEKLTFDATNHAVVDTITAADGSRIVRTSAAGFAQSETEYAAGATAAQSTVNFGYDVQGRATTAFDLKSVGSTRHYKSGLSLLDREEDGNGATVASYAYDRAGRMLTVTDANSKIAYRSYGDRGELRRVWGPATNPIEYEYDQYGQRTKMRTFRDTSLDFDGDTWPLAGYPSTSGDVTTWIYDPVTGWLTSKVDAKGRAVGFDYSFTATERKVVRIWKRNNASGVPITSTYTYDLATGDLKGVSYNDGTPALNYSDRTPALTYGYTRTGQLETVTDATGTRTFAYDHEQVAKETLGAAWYQATNAGVTPSGLILSTLYQNSTNQTAATVAGRYAGMSLGCSTNNNSDLAKELGVSVGYDALGRVNALTATYAAQGTRAALSVPYTVHYKDQTSLWDSISQGSFALERRFDEDHRYVLTSIATKWSSAPIAKYTYDTNAAGQRRSTLQEGSAFADYGDKTYVQYHYDSRGQLANDPDTGDFAAQGYLGSDTTITSSSNRLPGRGYGYTYDRAGNRQTANLDTDVATYRDESGNSGANAINQPVSRQTLKTHVSGSASMPGQPVPSVSVNGAPAGHVGAYWDAALGTFGQSVAVNVTATVGTNTQTASLTALVRPATESFVYDEDGNLSSDSQWTYTWDAENRLTQMSTQGWVAPARTLTFAYDYLGRRVRKVVQVGGTTTFDRKFVYDGWNLIAEVNAGNPNIESGSLDVKRTYVWWDGPLLETLHATAAMTAYHLAQDGNGNVTALVNQATGSPAAVYEYGPFGEQLRSSGPESLSNPLRFSGCYTDAETGLVYYGHRYYDPSQGRFISRDPIEETGGANLYGFCGNDSVNGRDWLGLQTYPDRVEPPDETYVVRVVISSGGDDATRNIDWHALIDKLKQFGRKDGLFESKVAEKNRAIQDANSRDIPTIQAAPSEADIWGTPIPLTAKNLVAVYIDGLGKLIVGTSTIGSDQYELPSVQRARIVGTGYEILRTDIGNRLGIDVNNPRFQIASDIAAILEGYIIGGRATRTVPGEGVTPLRSINISTEGLSAAERSAIIEYARRSNQWLKQNGPVNVKPTKGALRSQASAAARTERLRAARAGAPYQGQASHVPDTAISGQPVPPGGWLDMPGVSNNVAGGVLGNMLGETVEVITVDGIVPLP